MHRPASRLTAVLLTALAPKALETLLVEHALYRRIIAVRLPRRPALHALPDVRDLNDLLHVIKTAEDRVVGHIGT